MRREYGRTKDQALTIHSRINHRKEDHYHNKKEDPHHKRKRKKEDIYPILDVTHVMRRDTTPETIPETKAPPTRNRARKYIMITSLKMMNQQELEKK